MSSQFGTVCSTSNSTWDRTHTAPRLIFLRFMIALKPAGTQVYLRGFLVIRHQVVNHPVLPSPRDFRGSML